MAWRGRLREFMETATLVASLMTPPSPGGEEFAALPETVRWLEVRADLVGDVDPDWLRGRFRGQLLYTLRSQVEAGNFNSTQPARRERLLKAARQYDLIDLEGERDLPPDLLAEIPPEKRLISWHGQAAGVHELGKKFEKLSAVAARFYRLVVTARQASDECAPLMLLKSLARSDTIAFVAGQAGLWTRLVAPRLGAPMVFGAIDGAGRLDGEPTITRLIADYGLPSLGRVEGMYGIIGNPVSHSLSPRLHNAAYRALDHPALFVPFQVEAFADFWQMMVESGELEALGVTLKGLTVTSPHKEAALAMAGASTHMVKRAGSTNLFIRTNGIWTADTTDPEGVLVVLRERRILVEGQRAAVVGCGGSGRAVAAALDHAGAEVTLVNRGLERGRLAVRLLGLPFIPLTEFTAEGYSIVVNATPVGRDDGQVPFDVKRLSSDAVVVDLVYGSKPTPLAERSLARGLRVIDGRDVLLTQVHRQFQLMTGRAMPRHLAREILGWDVAQTSVCATKENRR
jgi:3-dehydroquinate dehydratase/shikimate dehydrogenase